MAEVFWTVELKKASKFSAINQQIELKTGMTWSHLHTDEENKEQRDRETYAFCLAQRASCGPRTY